MVRAEGLEPPRLAPPEPKSGVSANFTTPAGRSRRGRALQEKRIPHKRGDHRAYLKIGSVVRKLSERAHQARRQILGYQSRTT
jgi:hypothetical protein